jgi:hypothetical protein
MNVSDACLVLHVLECSSSTEPTELDIKNELELYFFIQNFKVPLQLNMLKRQACKIPLLFILDNLKKKELSFLIRLLACQHC